MKFVGSLFLITLLSGCIGKEYSRRGLGEEAWKKAPTLHDVPDEPEPMEKRALQQKEQDLRTKHKEKSVGLTVVK